MKNIHHKVAGMILLSTIGVGSLGAATPDKDSILVSIQKEIGRNMAGLKIEKMASPFFIDYRLNDLKILNVVAMRGQLVYSCATPLRRGLSTVLVGDYQNSNENAVLSMDQLYGQRNFPSGVVLGTDDATIRTCIWSRLDQQYKAAAEFYENKKSALGQMEIPEEERNIPDFQQMQPVVQILPVTPLKIDQKKIEEYVKKASEVFCGYNELNESYVRLYAGTADVRYCNSEGTACRYSNNLIAILICTKAQSADGQAIEIERCLPYASFEEIPSLTALQSICKAQADLLQQQLSASMINESYVGPVLFEGEAVADILNNFMVDGNNGILAKRKPISSSEVSRYGGNSALSGNELESMTNKKVISRDLSLTSLTGTAEYNHQKLFGHYEVDAQGVTPDKELVLIQDGVLKNMLTTRTPTRLFRASNGHARTSIDGQAVTTLPGVLRLSSKQTVSADALKQKLIAAAKEEDYEYAYIVRKIDAGAPSELYRVQVKDGKEELIRGAVMKNMTLRAFKRISGVSEKENIYNFIRNDVKSTYIVPSGVMFDEVDIVKDTKLVLKKNYIVDKP